MAKNLLDRSFTISTILTWPFRVEGWDLERFWGCPDDKGKRSRRFVSFFTVCLPISRPVSDSLWLSGRIWKYCFEPQARNHKRNIWTWLFFVWVSLLVVIFSIKGVGFSGPNRFWKSSRNGMEHFPKQQNGLTYFLKTCRKNNLEILVKKSSGLLNHEILSIFYSLNI